MFGIIPILQGKGSKTVIDIDAKLSIYAQQGANEIIITNRMIDGLTFPILCMVYFMDYFMDESFVARVIELSTLKICR